MKITVKFTDVYDGEEHERTEEIEVRWPQSIPRKSEEIEEWAYDEIFPHTGDGRAIDKNAGYFAEIVACEDRPDLVGREFEWGL